MLFLLLIRCFCFHSCFIIMQEEYDVYHQILCLMVGVYLHWQAPPSFRNKCNVYSWMVTSLQWTLCKKLNFSSALQMQSCHIIFNTNCITGWSILYPSLKVRCHENSYGEVSKCYETHVRNQVIMHPGLTHWPLRNFRHAIFKQISVIDGWGISCEITIIWMSLDFTNYQSTLV